MRTMFEDIWSDWKIGLITAVLLVAAAGLFSAWQTPRGPVTTPQALGSLGLAMLVGIFTGLLMGNRWSMLLAPVVFMAVFELARVGVDGPTVDAIRLGSTYGVIAFMVGRLIHGVLLLIPLVLGARYGVALAARLGNEAALPLGVPGWAVSGVVTVALTGLAVFIARPATVAPIVGADGQPLPGSIAEITTVPIGGHDQVLMIRGRSVDNPVLLYLAGGPGGTDLGAMRADVTLEQHFVVVTWEQRGVGKSYAALDPASTLTLEQMVSDTIEVTDYLRSRFGEEKVYLVGNSWGTFLGVLAVQQRPELFHAYVGTGQMVSPRETDIMFYEDTLIWAENSGQTQLVETLRRNGPPPYADLLDYEPALSHEHDWNPYPELDVSKEMPANLFVPENSLMDRINGLRSFLDTFAVLYPQLQQADFRADVTQLEVPVTIVMGAHEARGRAVLANEWFEMLAAPSKELVVFEGSGHRPLFEEPAAFAEVLQGILADSYVSR